jgi:hypothetical protein
MTEETLSDVDHTHPHTDETFGGVYRRGPAVADGAGPGVGVDCAVDECLGEVDHAADGAEAAADVWKRGPADADGTPAPYVRDGPAGGDEADR